MEPYKETVIRPPLGQQKDIAINNGVHQSVQSERIRLIIDEMVKGKSKISIVKRFSEEWGCPERTVKSTINEALVYLHHLHTGNTIEELRTEQVAKLEELYEQASVSEKLKIIDLISSTLGLYNTNVTVKTDDEIKINLGI